MANGRGETVGIERDRVDPFANEKRREIGVVAWGLAADSDLDTGRVRRCNRLLDHSGDRFIALVEARREVGGIPVDSEHELRQVEIGRASCRERVCQYV